MDKTEHPSWILITAFTTMSFCWAGRVGLPLKEMLVCAVGCMLQGIIIVILENKLTKRYTYICRFFGVLACSSFIILFDRHISHCSSGALNIIGYAVLPSAAGAMFVEGMATTNHRIGLGRMANAILCSLALALGITVSMILLGVNYV